jgi:hypothetical protein
MKKATWEIKYITSRTAGYKTSDSRFAMRFITSQNAYAINLTKDEAVKLYLSGKAVLATEPTKKMIAELVKVVA